MTEDFDLNATDLSEVDESVGEFGAVKDVQTRLRIRDIQTEKAPDGKEYRYTIKAFTDFENPTAVEPVTPGTVPSAPIVNLYDHNAKARGILKTFIESHGFRWADYVGSTDRLGFLRSMIGTSADAKIKLVTVNKKTGETLTNPRNNVRYIVPKAA